MPPSPAPLETRRAALSREARREAMIDAAEALFFELGFEGTTLGAVVRISGGSLATLYDEFGNKENLLRAVVDRIREEGLVDLKTLDDRAMSPREILLRVASRFHAYVTAPRTLASMRVVIGRSLADPAFGRAFHEDVRLQLLERIAETFRRWTAEGQARIDDPVAAAELFFASLLCDAPLKTMLGLPAERTDETLLAWRLQPFLDHFAIAG
ncbi:TetR/AcrR family transcriptional regulator [Sphingosinicella terrae]|uniref:TetR/AcrR family transcriptional regulator n=1 Tax=Sphingosinicella terrae TaxID=2172047 RepID=UPI0013B3C3DA|nr:TetR/AcrR family transcriptional regulator [Sphingosinicella terrae]